MSCGVGGRRGSDPMLLWLWHRPAVTAPIQPLAWELPYAVRWPKKEKKKRKKERREMASVFLYFRDIPPPPTSLRSLVFCARKSEALLTHNPTSFAPPHEVTYGSLPPPLFFSLPLFKAVFAAYVSSQARGLIGAAAADLHHSHSNMGSEPHLRPTPQLTAMLDP